MKKFFVLLITLLLISISVCENVFALQYLRYIDRTWNETEVVEQTKDIEDNYRLVDDLSSDSSITLDSGYWVVYNKQFKNRIKIKGDVHLIIDTTLICSNGIEVPKGSSLTIYGSDDRYSSLVTNIPGGSQHAAIGSNSGSTGGTIIIKSGSVNTYGNKGNNNAGIGGGNNATFEKIEIYGGNITAHGSDGGAGIGNGGSYRGSTSGEVIIYGGKINALGGNGGAGIGGGKDAYGVKTTIWGGTIQAEGAQYIEDGFISDTEYSGAGIGGGGDRGQARDIYIYGGTVTAKGSGISSGSAGIGGGSDSSGAKVIIGGVDGINCYVEAIGGPNAAGIGAGAGDEKDGCNVEFRSGVLIAYANHGYNIEGQAYAISGCDGGNNGKLTIPNDAKVTYGNSLAGNKTIALKNDRVNMAQSKIYARIDGCQHTDVTYKEIDAFEHHVTCKHCLYETDEDHTFEAGGHVCTKNCGYDGVEITFNHDIHSSGMMETIKVGTGKYEVPESEFVGDPGWYFLTWQPADDEQIYDNVRPGDTINVTKDIMLMAAFSRTIYYAAKIDEEIVGGTVELDNKEWHGYYAENKEVILNVNPEEGKSLIRLYYTDAEGSEVEISDKKTDGRYYFLMPAKDVTIHAIFDAPIAVEAISLENLEINEGGQAQLIPTITPENASDKRVTWESGDESIVRIDENGNIFGLSQGEATITVTTVDGNHQATCKVTVKHVHNLSHVEAKQATCEEKGNIEHYVCDKGEYHCDKHFKDNQGNEEIDNVETEALGHIWNEWHVVKEETEEEYGLKQRECTRDSSHTQKEGIPPTGHQCVNHLLPDPIEEVAATCTEVGYRAHLECECGKLYELKDTQATTPKVLSEFIIPALGHKAEQEPIIEEEKPATCTEDGSHFEIIVCERCKEELSRKTIVDKAFGHEWGPYVVTKEPTVFEEGTKMRYCVHDNSHHSDPESIPTVTDTLDIHTVKQVKNNTVGNQFEAIAKAIKPNGQTDTDMKSSNTRATMKFDDKSAAGTIIINDNTGDISGSSTLEGSKDGIEHTITIQLATKQSPIRTIAPKVSKTIKVITPELQLSSTCFDETDGATITVDDNQGQAIKYLKDPGSDITDAIIYHDSIEVTGNTIPVTEAGKYYVYTTPSQDGDTFYTRSFLSISTGARPASIEVKGHQWSDEVYYVYSDDYKTLTATRHCLTDETHVQTETVDVTSKVIKEATCEEYGETEYTSAEFENTAFKKQTIKLQDIEPIGHDYNNPEYEWSGDNKTVTASRKCKHDGTHMETETADTSSEISKDPTCTEKGETTYTATFENEAFEKQELTIDDIAALGHNWGQWHTTKQPTITEEGEEARECLNDHSHVETRPISKLDPTRAISVDPETVELKAEEGYKELTVLQDIVASSIGDEEVEFILAGFKDSSSYEQFGLIVGGMKATVYPKKGLTAGTYKASVVISDPKEKFKSLEIPVTFTVVAKESRYINTEGNGNVWYKDSNVDSVFVFENVIDDSITYPYFVSIQVDGKEVSKDNYTYKQGSVVINLSPKYLETLSLGEHTITAVFIDGSAAAKFKVLKKTTPDDKKSTYIIPKTGIE